LFEGESLRARLRRGVLGEAEAVSLLMTALRGVAAAHAKGVVHRDLKPENLFLCKAAPGVLPETVVLDFGLSKLLDSELVELTHRDARLGTPQYMAPEQVTNESLLDARCDIYAIGVILYEAVVGHRPFVASTREELFVQMLQQAPPALRAAAPHISIRYEQAVMRALSRYPAQRQPSIEALARELEPLGRTPFSGGTRESVVHGVPVVRAEPELPAPAQLAPAAHGKRLWPWAALLALCVLAITLWTSMHSAGFK